MNRKFHEFILLLFLCGLWGFFCGAVLNTFIGPWYLLPTILGGSFIGMNISKIYDAFFE